MTSYPPYSLSSGVLHYFWLHDVDHVPIIEVADVLWMFGELIFAHSSIGQRMCQRKYTV